jgi:hypothetical protein
VFSLRRIPIHTQQVSVDSECSAESPGCKSDSRFLFESSYNFLTAFFMSDSHCRCIGLFQWASINRQPMPGWSLDVHETHAVIVNPWAPRCFGIKKALINVILTSNTNFRKVINSDRLTRLFTEGRGIALVRKRGTTDSDRVKGDGESIKGVPAISSNTRGLAMATSKEINKWKRLTGGRDPQVKKIDRNWNLH